MAYLGELRDHARPLAAASIGIGTGIQLFAYTNAIFAPYLIEEFGWSRSQFALVGVLTLTTLLVLPLIGRFTDKVGVKRMATLGTILIPPSVAAYALQTGSFAYYLAIFTLVLAVASLTSPLVYTRLIAERFRNAQGLALTIATSAPALIGAVIARPLTWFNDAYGWRNGYLALALLVLAANLVALLLIPGNRKRAASDAAPVLARRSAREDFGEMVRTRSFWLIVGAFFLCMLPTPLQSSQLNVMLLDNGVGKTTAADLLSTFLVGSIVGRLLCGLALDRYPARIVAAVSMGVPALGYLLLASTIDAPLALGLAMFVVGFSFGAENDLLSYLVARYFPLEVFSSTLGFVYGGAFAASATGSFLLSLVLGRYDSFAPFLYLVTGTVVVGGFMFLLLPRASVPANQDDARAAGLETTGEIERV